jgi:predicted lactoylglutathione lyase
MHSQIFVNLPVKDLKRSVDFFTKLGYTFNPQFTDDNATCMIVGDNLFVMLLTEPFFGGFTSKAITDTTQSTEVLTCLSCNGKQQVDDLVAKARAAGARCRARRRTTASCTRMATKTSTATPGSWCT